MEPLPCACDHVALRGQEFHERLVVWQIRFVHVDRRHVTDAAREESIAVTSRQTPALAIVLPTAGVVPEILVQAAVGFPLRTECATTQDKFKPLVESGGGGVH